MVQWLSTSCEHDAKQLSLFSDDRVAHTHREGNVHSTRAYSAIAGHFRRFATGIRRISPLYMLQDIVAGYRAKRARKAPYFWDENQQLSTGLGFYDAATDHQSVVGKVASAYYMLCCGRKLQKSER